eukprot:GGOE01019852.1.p1 GENE.GGOE01019852.1~~GGOE01019852.1.p1  ORF type:complete len:455 (-),score=56.50 GGOE01019852.1:28-1392(-)
MDAKSVGWPLLYTVITALICSALVWWNPSKPSRQDVLLKNENLRTMPVKSHMEASTQPESLQHLSMSPPRSSISNFEQPSKTVPDHVGDVSNVTKRSQSNGMQRSDLAIPMLLKPGVLAKVQLCSPSFQPCNAACADGSTPVFYYRHGDPRKVVIWLQGGGFCSTSGRTDCFWGPCSHWRWSSNWTQPRYSVDEHHQGRGLLRSGGPLAGWTMAFAVYCDGLSFLGNATQGDGILKGVVLRVLADGREANVTEVILGGTSAGGLATIHQCNRIGDLVMASVPSVRRFTCVVEAGVFLDLGPLPSNSTMRSCFQALFAERHAVVLEQPSCRPHADCFMAFRGLQRLQYPTFVFQNLYDTWQARVVGMKTVCRRPREFRERAVQELSGLKPHDGVFTVGCWSHTFPSSAYQALAHHFLRWYTHNVTTRIFGPPFPRDKLCAHRGARPKSPCPSPSR